ncbi:MAG: OmpA family protein [Pseudomonadota bacterium]
MKTLARLMLGASAIAVAGCSQLPGSSLGATFGAERYLEQDRGGADFNGALAKEYTEVGRRAAFRDVRWYNSTAYISKARAAEAGQTPAPWAPEQLGVGGDAAAQYQDVLDAIAKNKDERPAECARAQAMWDQYLEALRGGDKYCITPADAKALLDEALAACDPAAVGPNQFVVFFGFARDTLTDAARAKLDEVVAAVQSLGTTAMSIVGHTDTVGSREFNQGLSERRARRVANALVDRGIPADSMTLAGRSFDELAVQTGPNVREQANRRVEITLSQ